MERGCAARGAHEQQTGLAGWGEGDARGKRSTCHVREAAVDQRNAMAAEKRNGSIYCMIRRGDALHAVAKCDVQRGLMLAGGRHRAPPRWGDNARKNRHLCSGVGAQSCAVECRGQQRCCALTAATHISLCSAEPYVASIRSAALYTPPGDSLMKNKTGMKTHGLGTGRGRGPHVRLGTSGSAAGLQHLHGSSSSGYQHT